MNRDKIAALDYFEEVQHKLVELQDILEQKEAEPITLNPFYNAMSGSKLNVDYVLVYDKRSKPEAKYKVNTFLKNLIGIGMQTEGYNSEMYPDLIYIKIHWSRRKLINAGTVFDLGLQFLAKRDLNLQYHVFCNFDFLFNDLTRPTELSDLAQRGSPDSVFNDKPKDITTAGRITVIHEILRHTKFGDSEDEFGIIALLQKKYIHSCFPLHDGDYKWSDEGQLNDRQILMEYWALTSNILKLQPLDLIKKYFGPQVAFYFAFIGHINAMLLFPSVLGIISIIYGALTFNDPGNIEAAAVCSSNLILCPQCYDRKLCDYEPLRESCTTTKFAYILNNSATHIYTLFWCLWGTNIFAKWKQKESVLMYKWDLTDLENDVTIRHEYLARLIRKKHAKITNILEFNQMDSQVDDTWYMKIIRYSIFATLLILLLLVIAGIIYMELYLRILAAGILGEFFGQVTLDPVSITLALLGNIFVVFFVCVAEEVFVLIAKYATDFENHITQESYDLAFVYIYAAMCIITSYSVIFFDAFLRGKLTTHPGEVLRYKMFGYYDYDVERVHSVCLSTCFRWTMLTIGKQAWRSCKFKMLPPIVQLWFRKRPVKQFPREKATGWDIDYGLLTMDNHYHHERCMNIVLQYGYLILFSGVQPLGPLMYFCYNLFLIRTNAKHILVWRRRHVPKRVTGLGPWLDIMKMLTVVGLTTNVFFLAFCTNFIVSFSRHFNPYFTNYINFTFSEFAVNDYPDVLGSEIRKGYENQTCYYKGNRHGPNSPEKYTGDTLHWNILCLRFIAVLIIQSMVIVCSSIIYFYVARVPHYIKERITFRLNNKHKEREERLKRERQRQSKKFIPTELENLRNTFKVVEHAHGE